MKRAPHSAPTNEDEATMFHKILAPLDGSAFSEQALPLALTIAARTSAALHFVVVHEQLPIDTFAQDGSYLDVQLRRWQGEYLDELRGKVEDGGAPAPATEVLEGPAAPTLEAYAAENGIDLIVMATHGRGGLTRAWLGSVADRLVRQVTMPLLLVRPEQDEPPSPVIAREELFHRILIPLDGSDLAEAILEPATSLGDLEDSEYDLVRVVPPPPPIGPRVRIEAPETDGDAQERLRAAAESYLGGVADRLQQPTSRRVRTSVQLTDSTAGGILAHAEASGADLIAMSTHGHGRLTRTLLGSHADKVLRAANVPVLIHHPPAA